MQPTLSGRPILCAVLLFVALWVASVGIWSSLRGPGVQQGFVRRLRRPIPVASSHGHRTPASDHSEAQTRPCAKAHLTPVMQLLQLPAASKPSPTMAPITTIVGRRTPDQQFRPIVPGKTASLTNRRGRPLTFLSPDCHSGTGTDIGGMVASRHGMAVVSSVSNVLLAKYPQNVRGLANTPLLACANAEKLVEESSKLQVFNFFKNNSDVRTADAFICAMPSTNCEALLSLNKTVIFAPGLRFSFKRCTKEMWQASIRIMQRAVKSCNPRHFVAAMSRYDVEYVKYFTGIDALPLYASTISYLPQAPFHATRPEILIGPLALDLAGVVARGGDPEFAHRLTARSEFKFISARDLYGRFSYEQVAQHRAAVLLPYAVMSIGMTELYAMGVSLFVPSALLMRRRPLLYPNDRTMTGLIKTYDYCGTSHSIVPEQHHHSNHSFSPESLTPAAKSYWLQYADFYQWPHVTFFDSIPDLIVKLREADFARTHDLMIEEWRRREARLDNVWRKIADGLDLDVRPVPARYYPMDKYLAT